MLPNTPASNRWHWRVLLLTVLIPNAAMWVFGKVSGTPRPFWDVDYFAAAIALALLSRPVAVVALLAAFIPDVLAITLPVFNVNDLGSKWEIVVIGLKHWPIGKLTLMGGTLLVVMTILVYGTGRRRHEPRQRWRLAGYSAAAACGLFLFDLGVVRGFQVAPAEGATHESRIACTRWGRELLYWHRLGTTFTGHGKAAFMTVAEDNAVTRKYLTDRGMIQPGGTMGGIETMSGAKPHVLLIIAESLGCLKADPGRAGLFQPLLRLADRYHVVTGEIPFTGSTFQGEMRELAWKVPYRPDFDPAGISFLPAALKKSGYRTVSVHGFAPSFFDRFRWYPAAGLDERIFLENFVANRPDFELQGRLFSGASDRDTVKEVERQLLAADEQRSPVFLHYMTLSGHFPVDLDYAGTCANPRVAMEGAPAEVIGMERIQTSMIDSIVKLSRLPLATPMDIIVVGDHPPPFIRVTSRDQYRTGRVPFIILRSVSLDLKPGANNPGK
ncbi:MAG: sulfatase-like hydrolase/transferase [Chthoniobacteraceae bacterium]